MFSPIVKKISEYFKKWFTIEPIIYEANPALLYILELDTSFVIISGILS